jgi:uncharacterized protein YjbI with pentapeptide repeats
LPSLHCPLGDSIVAELQLRSVFHVRADGRNQLDALARIRQADFSLATADRTRFHGANLSLTNFFGARLSSADLSEANLEGTTFVGAYLGGAHMNGAVLTGANFSGAELESASGLTQAQLNTACGDATTTLPAGMTIPGCSNNQ